MLAETLSPRHLIGMLKLCYRLLDIKAVISYPAKRFLGAAKLPVTVLNIVRCGLRILPY